MPIFKANLQIDQNELIYPLIHINDGAPIAKTATAGQMYFDNGSGVNKMYFHNGSNWIEFGAAGAGVANAYASMTDGTNTASSSGSDTFKFRSANNLLTVLVTNNEATHNDNLLLTINQANFELGASQITGLNATAAEINAVADLSATALTAGWVYRATGASAASWGQLLGSEISNTENWAPDQTSIAGITGTPAQFDTALTGNTFVYDDDTRLTDARTPLSHTHGNITNAGAIGSTTNLVVTTTTAGLLTTSSRSGIDSRTSFPIGSQTISELSDIPVEPTGGSTQYVLRYNDTGDVHDWYDLANFNNYSFIAGATTNADQSVLDGEILEILATAGRTTTSIVKNSTTVSITVDLATAGAGAAAYGSASQTNVFTLDAYGRVSVVTPTTISITEAQINNLGTAVTLNADTDVSGNSWVLDQDNLGDNSATKLATQQSIKAYVDNIVTGQMVYSGGYAASAVPPTGTGVLQGFTYTVTAASSGAGQTFWGSETLQIGDMIIAEQTNPTIAAHWTTVNKNIPDIVDASTSAKGIIQIATQAEVDTGTNALKAVTPDTLRGTPQLALTGATNISTRKYVEGSDASTVTGVNHGLGTDQVTVEVFESSSGDTVFADVSRVDTNNVNVTFSVAATSDQYTIVVTG